MVVIRADRQSATEREQDAANHRCHRESNTEQGRKEVRPLPLIAAAAGVKAIHQEQCPNDPLDRHRRRETEQDRKAIERPVTGSPFARATSASTLAKPSGRQIDECAAMTTAEMITSMSSCGLSTDIDLAGEQPE
jgi:hypothetical protein